MARRPLGDYHLNRQPASNLRVLGPTWVGRTRTINRLFWAALLALVMATGALRAQEPAPAQPQWRGLAISMAAHGAASGFDAWTSWQRMERNGFLADRGRFTTRSAYSKAGWFAGITLAEVLVVKKWGKKHPWIERACRIANFGSAGMLTSAGVHNLQSR